MWLHWCVYTCEWCLYVITRDGADDSATWLDKIIKGDTLKIVHHSLKAKAK